MPGEVGGNRLDQAAHGLVPLEMRLAVVKGLAAVRAARYRHIGAGGIDLPHLDRECLVTQRVGAVYRHHAATAAATPVEVAAARHLAQLDAERFEHLAWSLRRAAAAGYLARIMESE